MNALRFNRYAPTAITLSAVLAGCGGTQNAMTAPTAVIPQSVSPSPTHASGKSWMLPKAKSDDLLYVSNFPSALRVFSYPEGKPVGVLEVAHPAASCSDRQGNVYVGSRSEIFEYAHGGTVPINTLNTDPDGRVLACSVDPTTGNLAATVETYADQFYVAIFVGGKGNSENLVDSGLQEYDSCVYDGAGNLYVMGEAEIGYALTELPAKKSDFITLSLSQSIREGALQWDGKYLDVDNLGRRNEIKRPPYVIYQVSVTGSDATIVGTTQLSGHIVFGQPWLFRGTFVAARGARHQNDLAIWDYPAGGKPVNIIPPKYFSQHGPVFGVTVSVAPSGPRIHK